MRDSHLVQTQIFDQTSAFKRVFAHICQIRDAGRAEAPKAESETRGPSYYCDTRCYSLKTR